MTEHNMMIGIATVLATVGTLAGALLSRRFRKGYGISILIPFRAPSSDDQRVKNLNWLKSYWKAQLPGAEIVIGEDPEMDKPFSKSAAVNDAAARAKGDIFVIIDADGYIKAESVLHCAQEIREARKRKQRLWFVPYRQFYRLTQDASQCLLQSDPRHPFQF